MRGRVNAIRTFKGLVADLRVTKNIPSNCVVAGIPSQIVKEDIYWEK